MDGAALLLLPSGLEIDRIDVGATALTVSVTSLLPTSTCPLCRTSATRIHSRYHRTVADVTCGGRQVRLWLTARKFFCDTPECARKIFDSAALALPRALGAHDNPAGTGAL